RRARVRQLCTQRQASLRRGEAERPLAMEGLDQCLGVREECAELAARVADLARERGRSSEDVEPSLARASVMEPIEYRDGRLVPRYSPRLPDAKRVQHRSHR